jgi:hypothetical protein
MRQGMSRAPVIRRLDHDGRTIREVRHPLPPELLVAEFAGELPPDVARAVREHVATCDTCGDRARTLAAPYELLGTLGAAPVLYVPDLRRRVRNRLSKTHFLGRLVRAAVVLGRGGLAGITALIAVALVAALLVVTNVFRVPQAVDRSSNQLDTVPPAGASGVLYAETGKVSSVTDGAQHTWLVAEIIAADQRTGRVLRSLPAGGPRLRVAGASELPKAVALSPDGQVIYEIASDGHGQQALVAIEAQHGAIQSVTSLSVPGTSGESASVPALSLAVAPDGNTIYVGLGLGRGDLADPRVLVLGNHGKQVDRTLTPSLPASVSLPPTSGGLPGVVTTSPTPTLTTTGLRPSLAADGALVVSPDGLALYDAIRLDDAHGQPQDAVIRRFGVASGTTEAALALTGDFTLSAMAFSPSAARPYLYVARVGADGQAYILGASVSGPTFVAQIPLGGLSNLAGVRFSGTVAISPTADGTRAYVSDDAVPQGYQLGSHDTWLLDSASATIVSHRFAFNEAGQALANWAGGDGGKIFVLVSGQIGLLPPDLMSATSPSLWLQLKDGVPVTRLVGTAP